MFLDKHVLEKRVFGMKGPSSLDTHVRRNVFLQKHVFGLPFMRTDGSLSYKAQSGRAVSALKVPTRYRQVLWGWI